MAIVELINNALMFLYIIMGLYALITVADGGWKWMKGDLHEGMNSLLGACFLIGGPTIIIMLFKLFQINTGMLFE